MNVNVLDICACICEPNTHDDVTNVFGVDYRTYFLKTVLPDSRHESIPKMLAAKNDFDPNALLW